MMVLGITGGTGCGKTTALDAVTALGCAVLDCDALYHALLETSRPLLEAQKQSGKRLVAMDAIRLLESDLVQLCNRTIAVLAPTEDRVRRLIAREGISEEYARLRIAAQPTNEAFSARCDAVLMNDCASAAEFAARCRTLFEKMLKEDPSNAG